METIPAKEMSVKRLGLSDQSDAKVRRGNQMSYTSKSLLMENLTTNVYNLRMEKR